MLLLFFSRKRKSRLNDKINMHSKDMILSCPMTINYTHTHTQRHICTDFMLLFIYVIVQCYYNMSSAACVSTIDWWLHQVCAFLCIYFSVVAIAIAFVSLSFLFTVFFLYCFFFSFSGHVCIFIVTWHYEKKIINELLL